MIPRRRLPYSARAPPAIPASRRAAGAQLICMNSLVSPERGLPALEARDIVGVLMSLQLVLDARDAAHRRDALEEWRDLAGENRPAQRHPAARGRHRDCARMTWPSLVRTRSMRTSSLIVLPLNVRLTPDTSPLIRLPVSREVLPRAVPVTLATWVALSRRRARRVRPRSGSKRYVRPAPRPARFRGCVFGSSLPPS